MSSRDDHEPIFAVRNLKKHYPISGGFLKGEIGRVRAVDGITFELQKGETLGIVGESGCGKSTAATTMIRLEEPTSGEISYKGENVTEYDRKALKKWRREVQMIFQDPDSSFDPRMSIGETIAEPLTVQGMTDKKRRDRIVADLLKRIGLQESDMHRYPHELSGGQKQRVGLARALSVNPEVIIADEPVSALDVSIQSAVLKLIKHLVDTFDLTMIVISHNLSVVREICDRVAVMYLGEFVEMAPTDQLFDDPQHPYTRALLSAIPTPDPRNRGLGIELKGDVPDPSAPPSGCRFHTRCPEVIQPPEVDLPQDIWQNLLRFRLRVNNRKLDVDSIAEIAAVEGAVEVENVENVTAEDVPDEHMEAQIRQDYQLPDPLPDSRAERSLAAAISALLDDDFPSAQSELDEWFVTPCELEKPALEAVGNDHRAACLLHHDDVERNIDRLREQYANLQTSPTD